MITYQEESLKEFLVNGKYLWLKHYEKMGDKTTPLSLAFDTYEYLEKFSDLIIVTVKEDTTLIGYCVVVIQQHPHYSSTSYGIEDAFYIDAEKCPGLSLAPRYYKLLSKVLQVAVRRGVNKIVFTTKGLDSVLKVIGFHPAGTIYERNL